MHENQCLITLSINKADHQLKISPSTTLLDALREHLHLTGTKKGCDHGQCGACTVLVNGKHINSCLTLAVMCEDHAITTIEGLGDENELDEVQKAFIAHDAFQCGYCTPGQICAVKGLLQMERTMAAEEIRDLMSGNLCRCGAYKNIFEVAEQFLSHTNR